MGAGCRSLAGARPCATSATASSCTAATRSPRLTRTCATGTRSLRAQLWTSSASPRGAGTREERFSNSAVRCFEFVYVERVYEALSSVYDQSRVVRKAYVDLSPVGTFRSCTRDLKTSRKFSSLKRNANRGLWAGGLATTVSICVSKSGTRSFPVRFGRY